MTQRKVVLGRARPNHVHDERVNDDDLQNLKDAADDATDEEPTGETSKENVEC
ncbi:hypothetical protein Cni_G18984 [Canna indica]|uniref:Uncharacterized protein n=1 Tax=Canna indica TaxID=4628 RepID=A0AAQ3QJB0_9LILI|nr:hypothetical protein Cni_G18984 [Canna indica]